ncbi:MAG: M23 family metallopeptidase [Calditrichia bacterium]|nr:M23 family metallopeptidase [Calditrichia bacterium]
MKKADVKIVIFPDEKHEPRNYSIKKRTIAIFLILIITVMVLNIIGATTYFKLANIALNYNELQGENKVLINQLQKLNTLEKEFSKLKKYNNKIRGIIGNQISITTVTEADSENIVFKNADIASIFNTVPVKMPTSGYISRKFDIDEHHAIDIAAESGSPIMATSHGRVIFSGWTKDVGNVVIIFHGQNTFSMYKYNLRNIVEEGEFVSSGQVIAVIGGTGKISSGPHLHFEIWKDNHPVDPLFYINKN